MNPPFPSVPPLERKRGRNADAFTLVEIMVATTLLLILMGVTATMISSTQQVWNRTSSQTDQLRSARHAFDIVSHRVAQATLNAYWTVTYDKNNAPLRYERASELRFRSGAASTMVSGAAPGGSAIFFQSPTGYYSDGSGDLGCALNTWGYFIEYGSDLDYRPSFLNNIGVPERYRYRLIEFLDPSDKLALFNYTSGTSGKDYKGSDWFTLPLGATGRKRILADNIIAFVILPRLSSMENDDIGALARNLDYSSTDKKGDAKLNPRNQLPPIVEIAAVVIDEQSAAKIRWDSTPPDFGIARENLFRSAASLESDLETLRDALRKKNVEAEIFRMTVPIVAARWSTEQTDP